MVPERDDVVLDAWAHEFCDVGEECVVGGCGAEGDDDSTWLAGWGLGVGVRTSADFDEGDYVDLEEEIPEEFTKKMNFA